MWAVGRLGSEQHLNPTAEGLCAAVCVCMHTFRSNHGLSVTRLSPPVFGFVPDVMSLDFVMP